jgi:hypothetical protein
VTAAKENPMIDILVQLFAIFVIVSLLFTLLLGRYLWMGGLRRLVRNIRHIFVDPHPEEREQW